MSSFEPGELLVPRAFVTDRDAVLKPRFERDASDPGNADAGTSTQSPSDSDPETLWLRGYAAGHDSARAELPWREAEGLERAAGVLTRAATSVATLRRDYLGEQRRAVVELALLIAERIVAREIEGDLDGIAAVLERAVPAVSEEGAVEVMLSEADHEILNAGSPSQLEALGAAEGLTLRPSPDLASGEVRVRAGSTEIDARLATLLARVREGLEECLAQGGNAS